MKCMAVCQYNLHMRKPSVLCAPSLFYMNLLFVACGRARHDDLCLRRAEDSLCHVLISSRLRAPHLL